MPWISLDNQPADIGVAPKAPEPVDLASPGVGETFGAAFRLDNTIGSFASNQFRNADLDTMDPMFNPWEAAKGTNMERYPDRIAQTFNQKAFDALQAQIEREEEDRRTLNAAGWLGTLSSVTAGVVDLPSLIPVGRFAQGARLGYDVGKSALSIGAATAGAVAVQEAALQSTQETRSPVQSGIAIGGGAILGAMLGAAGAKLLDNVTWNDLAKRMEKEIYSPEAIPADAAEAEMKALVQDARVPAPETAGASAGSPASAGAAAVDAPSLEGLTVYGRAARAATNATAQLNPLLRALSSPSAETRNILLNLMENPVYLKANYGGQASARAVETIVKAYDGAYVSAMDATRADWRAARQAGEKLSWPEYRARVGQAMRTGDLDAGGSEFISKSAQNWRAKLFDPLKAKGIDASLLPEDVGVDTAQSYFTRVYNRVKIEAREGEFKQIVRDWARGEIAAQAKSSKAGGDLANMSEQELNSYIEDVVNSIYNKITGRAVDMQGESPFRIVANARGPLKERTFHIADEKIASFLIDDIEQVGRRYARTMGADIELSNASRRLGGDGKPDLKSMVAKIRADYEKLRSGITGEKALLKLAERERADIRDLEAVRDMLRGQYLPVQNASGWAKIVNAAMTFNYLRTMGGVTIASLSDAARPIMVHGLKRWMGSGIKPLVTNLKGFKMAAHEAKLAGVVGERTRNATLATYAELTDPYSVQSPFQRFLDNTARAFSTATLMPMWNDFQKSFASVITQNRILENCDSWAKSSPRAVSSEPPLAKGSVRLYRGEGALDKSKIFRNETVAGRYYSNNLADAEKFAKQNNGSVYYIDVPQSRLNELAADSQKPDKWFIVSDALKNEKKPFAKETVIKTPNTGLNESEQAYMQYLGIDQSMAERILKEFNTYGEMIDGVRAANTEKWADDIAREAYRAAIAKDVDSIIVTKGIGDVPLFVRTPTGRALMQFKGFALAAHQRAFIRGLQEDQASVVSGLIASTTIGAFIYYLKTVEAGRWDDLSDNPGRFVAEGLDRSGMFPLMFEVNNIAEKIGAPGVYTGLQAIFPNKTQKQPASRYATRSVVDSYLGPTVGGAQDAVGLVGTGISNLRSMLGDDDAKAGLMPSDIAAMRRLMPGASLPWFRAAIDNTVVPWLKETVE